MTEHAYVQDFDPTNIAFEQRYGISGLHRAMESARSIVDGEISVPDMVQLFTLVERMTCRDQAPDLTQDDSALVSRLGIDPRLLLSAAQFAGSTADTSAIVLFLYDASTQTVANGQ